MEQLSFLPEHGITIFVTFTIFLISTAVYHESIFLSQKHLTRNPTLFAGQQLPPTGAQPTTLQQHILFWLPTPTTTVLHPSDIYTGFRRLGFTIPFSLTALLIPIFFSYPTRLAHSYIPDPWFGIHLDNIHKAKHGSDSGAYDLKGNFRKGDIEELLAGFDSSAGLPDVNLEVPVVKGERSLSAPDLWRLVKRNRVAADPAGWTFAMMEWSTTFLLLQREGRVWEEDLRACYDGSLFWVIAKEVREGRAERGYGVEAFWRDAVEGFPILRGL